MNYNRPIIISIAGFDPTGGAGLLADIKTIEQHHCLGMGVISALTVQTEDTFIAVEWMNLEKIKQQLEPLLKNYKCSVIKIGIMPSITLLDQVLNFIRSTDPQIKIVWDPVIASTSGFTLLDSFKETELAQLLKKLSLITPNTQEAVRLTGIKNDIDAAKYLSENCSVLLKGGHSESNKGIDLLFTKNEFMEIRPDEGSYYSKHGSGCILSSAIACGLAEQKTLEESCISAKRYIQKILKSNDQLLAYHAS